MTNDVLNSFVVIAVVASITALTRVAPFLLFGRKKEIPPILNYLSLVLPASIMIVLVVYCLRNINLTVFPYGLAELISVAVIITAQVLKKNTFLSIFLGTACYMILIRTVFPM